MCSNGNPNTGITVIKKDKSFQDEMQVTDKGILLKNVMVLENYMLVVMCCLLMTKLQKGTVNYATIFWNSIIAVNPDLKSQ